MAYTTMDLDTIDFDLIPNIWEGREDPCEEYYKWGLLPPLSLEDVCGRNCSKTLLQNLDHCVIDFLRPDEEPLLKLFRNSQITKYLQSYDEVNECLSKTKNTLQEPTSSIEDVPISENSNNRLATNIAPVIVSQNFKSDDNINTLISSHTSTESASALELRYRYMTLANFVMLQTATKQQMRPQLNAILEMTKNENTFQLLCSILKENILLYKSKLFLVNEIKRLYNDKFSTGEISMFLKVILSWFTIIITRTYLDLMNRYQHSLSIDHEHNLMIVRLNTQNIVKDIFLPLDYKNKSNICFIELLQHYNFDCSKSKVFFNPSCPKCLNCQTDNTFNKQPKLADVEFWITKYKSVQTYLEYSKNICTIYQTFPQYFEEFSAVEWPNHFQLLDDNFYRIDFLYFVKVHRLRLQGICADITLISSLETVYKLSRQDTEFLLDTNLYAAIISLQSCKERINHFDSKSDDVLNSINNMFIKDTMIRSTLEVKLSESEFLMLLDVKNLNARLLQPAFLEVLSTTCLLVKMSYLTIKPLMEEFVKKYPETQTSSENIAEIIQILKKLDQSFSKLLLFYNRLALLPSFPLSKSSQINFTFLKTGKLILHKRFGDLSLLLLTFLVSGPKKEKFEAFRKISSLI